jgi:hypothetical protein
MYTRTKLMKKVERVKVPTYKWVVEEVCCDCASNCGYVELEDAKPFAEQADKSAK